MPAEADFIRQFRSPDAEACSRLMHACLNHDPLVPAAARRDILLRETPEIMSQRARSFYVAVYFSGGAAAGIGGVDLNEIRMLFVAPGQRRRGIGSALLKHLESWIPPALFRSAFVYSTPGAVDFYRFHGYEPGGCHVFPGAGSSIPTIFMTKRLAS